MEGRRSCEGEEGSSSIGSAILGADGSSQESEEQRGEEGSWEMDLQGRREELGDGYAIWEERFQAKKREEESWEMGV